MNIETKTHIGAEMLVRKGLSWQDNWHRLFSAVVWLHQTGKRASFWTSIRARVEPLTVATIMVPSSLMKLLEQVLVSNISEMWTLTRCCSALCLVEVSLMPSSLFASCRRSTSQLTNYFTSLLCLCQPWESLRSSFNVLWYALKDPLGRGMGYVCYPRHVLQCLESDTGQWSVQWWVWHGSWCASGLCP